MKSPTTLWWLTDSDNVARIYRRGSGDMALMRLALQVLELALELNLDLERDIGFPIRSQVAKG
jgi:hypothetical protein